MNRIFRHTKTAPLTDRIRSRECCTYLYLAMKFAGWIPSKRIKNQHFYIFWKYLIFSLATFYTPVGFGLTLFKDFGIFTPGVFLRVLQTSLNAAGGTAKVIIVLLLISYLHQTRQLLDQLDERLKTDSDRRKIHKMVALCNYAFLAYVMIFTGYTTSMFVSGVLIGQPPWMIYNPFFNWRDGVRNFWLQVMLEYIVGSTYGLTLLIADTYPLMFIMIFRAHVDILKEQIHNLRSNPHKTENENHEELVSCVIYHKLILKCCNLMRPVVSRTIFVQFLLIGIVLGLTLINVLYFSGILNIISSIVYLIMVLLETFPFCYLCDLLRADCNDLSITLAQSKWIDAEPKYKSTLKIFLHHLQQPITFNAGGFFTISVDSNVKMVKVAFSVMTIVEKMNLADRLQEVQE